MLTCNGCGQLVTVYVLGYLCDCRQVKFNTMNGFSDEQMAERFHIMISESQGEVMCLVWVSDGKQRFVKQVPWHMVDQFERVIL